MKLSGAKYKDLPLEIAGSTKFGRFPKISNEQTFNMILSDNWLVPFAGYRNVVSISNTGQGRGIYTSTKLNFMFAVIDASVYKFDAALNKTLIGKLNTFTGDVFISENNGGQIAFTDQQNIYIYDTQASPLPTFTVATFPGTPGYLTFQNGFFIAPDIATNFWYLSPLNNGHTWVSNSQTQGAVQTKPDHAVACIRFPGRGNLLMVFGSTIGEQWYNVSSQLFPYQRSQSTNIDYGCINPASIAESDIIVCWIASNEKAGPTIMYTEGGDIKKISTDGIDFKLAELTQPANVYGFMFRQDGHLFYVVTWPADNVSYAYDFNTDKFYTLCDENMNAFIVKRIAFFNEKYYFVSIRDGNLYQLSSDIPVYDYGNGKIIDIPRIRVTPPIQMPDQSRFVAGYSGFTIEQGQFNYDYRDTTFAIGMEGGSNEIGTEDGIALGGGYNYRTNVPRIDMSLSKDGAQSFGSFVSINMNREGVRANRLMWWRLGAANELIHQYRFYGMNRFVANSGICGVYQ